MASASSKRLKRAILHRKAVPDEGVFVSARGHLQQEVEALAGLEARLEPLAQRARCGIIGSMPSCPSCGAETIASAATAPCAAMRSAPTSPAAPAAAARLRARRPEAGGTQRRTPEAEDAGNDARAGGRAPSSLGARKRESDARLLWPPECQRPLPRRSKPGPPAPISARGHAEMAPDGGRRGVRREACSPTTATRRGTGCCRRSTRGACSGASASCKKALVGRREEAKRAATRGRGRARRVRRARRGRRPRSTASSRQRSRSCAARRTCSGRATGCWRPSRTRRRRASPSVDARLAKLEAELAHAQAEERAIAGELASAQAALARGETKLKRAESELRSAQQREADGARA